MKLNNWKNDFPQTNNFFTTKRVSSMKNITRMSSFKFNCKSCYWIISFYDVNVPIIAHLYLLLNAKYRNLTQHTQKNPFNIFLLRWLSFINDCLYSAITFLLSPNVIIKLLFRNMMAWDFTLLTFSKNNALNIL